MHIGMNVKHLIYFFWDAKQMTNVTMSAQALAVRVLLAHRLSGESAEAAKADWYGYSAACWLHP